MSVELKNLILMIVEDELEYKHSLSQALAPHFAKIIQAKNGEEGFKKFKKYKPHLILTDVFMPRKDGLDMAKEIKNISRNTPIIVLSALLEKERLLRAIDINIDKYLIKPYEPEKLVQIIEKICKDKLGQNCEVEICPDYKFNHIKKVLIHNGKEVALTKKELSFISLLMRNVGALVSHEEIKKNVWINSKVSDAAIRTLIKRIRDKVGPNFIKNIPGLGYKIVE